MTTSYPGAVDNFANPSASSGNKLDTPGVDHDRQHANANDAIEAIETFVGPEGAPAGVGTLVGRIKTLEAGGGGGGGAGEADHVVYLMNPTPGASGSLTPIPLTMIEEAPPGQTNIGIQPGFENLQLQPGVYSIHVLISLVIGFVGTPPGILMESGSAGLTHAFPGAFCPINDAGASWMGQTNGTFYFPSTGVILISYGGNHDDINSGLVTVTRLRDI